jgi:hypothetical protein
MKKNKIGLYTIIAVFINFAVCFALDFEKSEDDVVAVTEEKDKNIGLPNIESMASSQNVLCAADPTKEERMADILGTQSESDDSDA